MALFIILILIFAAYNLLFWNLLRKRVSSKLYKKQNKFSIVVAAKNEEQNVGSLIDSLNNIDYPEDHYEVIIVDDNSIDNTYNHLLDLTKGINNFKLVKAKNKKYKAKKGALDIGISNSRFEIIVITDADCKVTPNWLKHLSDKFNEGNDFVFGVSSIIEENNLANKIVQFEKLRNSILMFSASRINLPYCINASNFSYKKSSFYKLNGFENTQQTISGDDDLLLKEAVKANMNIDYILSDGSEVHTRSVNKISSYVKQRIRHTSTSHHYLLKHKLFLGIWHLTNLIMLFSPFLSIFSKNLIYLLPIKFFIDILTVILLQKLFKYKFSIFRVAALQLIYELMLIVSYFGSILVKPKWKE